MSQAEIDGRLAKLAEYNKSNREVLRRKVVQLVRELNGGSTTIGYGPIRVDIFVEFERSLQRLSDGQVSRALVILRE
jgi:hypothetical protein